MNDQTMNARLLATATALPSAAVFSKQRLLDMAIVALDAAVKTGTNYHTIKDVEGLSEDALDALPLEDLTLATIAAKLRLHGVPLGDTIGSIRAVYGWEKHDIHELVCSCHENHDFMPGENALVHLKELWCTL